MQNATEREQGKGIKAEAFGENMQRNSGRLQHVCVGATTIESNHVDVAFSLSQSAGQQRHLAFGSGLIEGGDNKRDRGQVVAAPWGNSDFGLQELYARGWF